METVASLWACDPGDLSRHEPWAAYEFPPAAPLTWTEQLSPHLHRNKQLQDMLLQREEELQRLQDENQELRRFLSSAFVRNLEQKVQRVAADRKKLKRNLEDLSICRPLQVSKRVCRNLTAQLNSASSESLPSPEPNLDLWVLRTLGLKDRDTIDTSSQSSSDLPLRALVYDTVTPSPGHALSSTHSSTLSSALSPPLSSTHSSTFSSTLSPTLSSTYSPTLSSTYSPTLSSALSPTHSSTLSSTHSSTLSSALSPTLSSTLSSALSSTHNYCPSVTPDLAGHPEANSHVWSDLGLNGFRRAVRTSPLLHPNLTDLCTATSLSTNPAACWSPSQGSAHFNPPAERFPFSPSFSAWISDRPRTPPSSSAPTSPPAAKWTPRGRTAVAFRVSLSPSSSVKTHSFPQGQAFTCKDLDGRWSFTWVPRQEP